MNYILDACTLICYMRGEVGVDKVLALLDEQTPCYVHQVNLIEVYYHFYRFDDEKVALAVLKDIKKAGIQSSQLLDEPFSNEVGKLKAEFNIPLADCFVAALAKRLNGTVVTADHPDFEPLEKAKICLVHFIR